MGGRRGSAIVFAMLLLVLLSGIGIYAVSRPLPAGESPGQHQRSAVARNMARAGLNAAIARLPDVSPEAAPYVRRIPVGPNATGRYAVTSRKSGVAGALAGPGKGPVFEEYVLVSDGSVAGDFSGTFRVRAEVRFGPVPSSAPRAYIRKWEESGPR